ncbi:hypothetical protein ACU8V7_05015 [Zobellia nedashkovskayae]
MQRTYTYTVTATSPCTVNSTSEVVVSEQATPNAGTDGTLTICEGTTVTETQLFDELGGSPEPGGNWTPTMSGARNIHLYRCGNFAMYSR